MNWTIADFPDAKECIYTSHYCEENIWKLCELLNLNKCPCLDSCYCVFVSNEKKITPLWFQKVGSGEKFFVAWDYHVFLVWKNGLSSYVYDFDTILGFPVAFTEYLEKSIGSEINMNPAFYRYFRVILANDYLRYFSSDRRDMKNANGEWLKPPPPYAPIQSNESDHNLDKFTSMKQNEVPGILMNLEGFRRFFENMNTLP